MAFDKQKKTFFRVSLFLFGAQFLCGGFLRGNSANAWMRFQYKCTITRMPWHLLFRCVWVVARHLQAVDVSARNLNCFIKSDASTGTHLSGAHSARPVHDDSRLSIFINIYVFVFFLVARASSGVSDCAIESFRLTWAADARQYSHTNDWMIHYGNWVHFPSANVKQSDSVSARPEYHVTIGHCSELFRNYFDMDWSDIMNRALDISQVLVGSQSNQLAPIVSIASARVHSAY